jgi:hypothetical protein
MATYYLERDREQTKKHLKKILPMILLAFMTAFSLAFTQSREFPEVIVIAPFIFIILIFAIIVVFSSALKRQSTSLFIVDNNQITFRQSGHRDVTVGREDVKHILESADEGLTIKTSDPYVVIYVPNKVLNYDRLKTEISSWQLIETGGDEKKYTIIIYLMLSSQIIFAIGAFLFKTNIFYYLIGISFALFIAFRFTLDLKSFLVQKDKKKLVYLIIPTLIIGYALFIIISSLFK